MYYFCLHLLTIWLHEDAWNVCKIKYIDLLANSLDDE